MKQATIVSEVTAHIAGSERGKISSNARLRQDRAECALPASKQTDDERRCIIYTHTLLSLELSSLFLSRKRV